MSSRTSDPPLREIGRATGTSHQAVHKLSASGEARYKRNYQIYHLVLGNRDAGELDWLDMAIERGFIEPPADELSRRRALENIREVAWRALMTRDQELGLDMFTQYLLAFYPGATDQEIVDKLVQEIEDWGFPLETGEQP